VLLTDMQNECAAQIAELRSLFEAQRGFGQLARPSRYESSSAGRSQPLQANDAHPNAAAGSSSSPSSAQPSGERRSSRPLSPRVWTMTQTTLIPHLLVRHSPRQKRSRMLPVRQRGRSRIDKRWRARWRRAQPARTLRRSTLSCTSRCLHRSY